MKNIKSLKFLVLIGVLAVPLTTAISCGEKDNGGGGDAQEPGDETEVDNKILYLKTNEDEFKNISKAIAQVETEIDYTFKRWEPEEGQEDNLETAIASENKPLLAWLGDNDGVAQARLPEDKRLYQTIDLDEISKAKYDTNYYQKSFNFLDKNSFFQGMWQAVAIPGKFESDKEVIGIPMKAQSQSLFVKESLFDGSTTIKMTVPNKDGGFEVVDTNKELTLENAYAFIYDAANNETNLPVDWTEPETIPSGWLKGGPLAQYQRIGSIINSINPESKGFDGKGMESGFAKDMNLEWELVASLETIYDKANFNLDDEKLAAKLTETGFVDDQIATTLWQTFFGYYQTGTVTGNNQDFPLFQDPNYYAEGGEGELIFNRNSALVKNHAWMHGTLRNSLGVYEKPTYVNYDETLNKLVSATEETHQYDLSKVKANGQNQEQVETQFAVFDAEYGSLPIPYSEAVTGSWAIPKGLNEEQSGIAMKLIRAIIDETPLVNVEGWDNPPSTINSANVDNFNSWAGSSGTFVDQNLDKIFLNSYSSPYIAPLISGHKYLAGVDFRNMDTETITTLDAINYNGIPGTYRKTSSGSKFDVFNSTWGDLRDDKWKPEVDKEESSYVFDFNAFKTYATEAFKKAWDTIKLTEEA